MTDLKPFLFIGPFPSPITGQTVSTASLRDKLLRMGMSLQCYNIVRGDSSRTSIRTAVRIVRVSRVILAMFASIGRASVAYVSVDANSGMLVTIVLSLAARFSGKRLLLHYHSYSHLEQPRRLMRWLVRISGRSAVHIHICPAMTQRAKQLYPSIVRTAELSNAHVIAKQRPSDFIVKETNDCLPPFRIGFLGRLSKEKGASIALEVFRQLRARCHDVSLVLAGPFVDEEVKREALATRDEHSSQRVHLPGMIKGEQIDNFYEHLDVFLFPTLYRNETQGIVNLEAMSHGVPVIAYGRCCVPSDVGTTGGIVIATDKSFVDRAVAVIENWMNDRSNQDHRCEAARRRFNELHMQSLEEIHKLTQLVAELPKLES